MKKYLLNAFSFQMVPTKEQKEGDIHYEVIPQSEVPFGDKDLISAVGHPDTAAVLGVEFNRMTVKLHPGDVAYIAQLQGGRLPEGCTTLPEGCSFEFIKVTID